MAQLSIDAEDMEQAFCTNDPETTYYLDLQNGEIVLVMSEGMAWDEDDSAERVESEPERYLEIEPMPSRFEFDVIKEFIGQLPSPAIREKLSDALAHRHHFRAFKDAIAAFPAVRNSWFDYRSRAYQVYAEEWLHDNGIDAVLHRRPPGQTGT